MPVGGWGHQLFQTLGQSLRPGGLHKEALPKARQNNPFPILLLQIIIYLITWGNELLLQTHTGVEFTAYVVRCRPITWLVAKLHEWQIKSLDNEVRGKEWNTCFYSTPSIKMPFTFLRRESDFEMVWDREREVKLFVKRFSWILVRRDFWGPRTGDWGLSWLGMNPHQRNILFSCWMYCWYIITAGLTQAPDLGLRNGQ